MRFAFLSLVLVACAAASNGPSSAQPAASATKSDGGENPGARRATPATSGQRSLRPVEETARTHAQADLWRTERRLIDLHTHITPTKEYFERAARVMDTAGIGIAVNLSGGTTTRVNGK